MTNTGEMRECTPREYAKIRLTRWAAILRSLYYYGAPRRNLYSKTTFIDGKIDPDQLRYFIEFDERLDEALETDEWMMVLQEKSPTAYMAVLVRYLEREPGTSRPLGFDDQASIFRLKTGKGKSTYYAKLREAERFVAFSAGIGEPS